MAEAGVGCRAGARLRARGTARLRHAAAPENLARVGRVVRLIGRPIPCEVRRARRRSLIPFDLGPKPLLGYTASILERVAERRTDASFLAACEADARAGTFAIGGELVVMKKGRNGADPLFRPDEARALAP